jgi:hypothetical protein
MTTLATISSAPVRAVSKTTRGELITIFLAGEGMTSTPINSPAGMASVLSAMGAALHSKFQLDQD